MDFLSILTSLEIFRRVGGATELCSRPVGWPRMVRSLQASTRSCSVLEGCDVHHNLAGHSLMSHWRGDPVGIQSYPLAQNLELPVLRGQRRTTVQLPTHESFITRRSGHIVQRRTVETLLGLKHSKQGGGDHRGLAGHV